MIISELNHLQVIAEAGVVEGGTYYGYPTYYEYDKVVVDFTSNNNFHTSAKLTPHFDHNSASAGAKADAIGSPWYYTDSFTKADTLSVAKFGGGSFSASTSSAIIKPGYQ